MGPFTLALRGITLFSCPRKHLILVLLCLWEGTGLPLLLSGLCLL